MSDFRTVARVSDLPAGGVTVVVVAGREIALFNLEGTFFAVDNACLHRGGPIGEGFLDGSYVTCPWHGWQYDVRTGQSLTNPGARLRTYAVRVEGDEVQVAP